METGPLKSFATWARSALITEVTARLSAVLAQGSPERTERPGEVAALEKVIAAAGGGQSGKAAVADRVAYTWFNRIIAFRFMDANGYTSIGVVSPGPDVGGQPEMLAAAKGGHIDAAVVSNVETRDIILGLLGGIRKSPDPQREAYSILLVEYCRDWNRVMPFMFEREGDFTELLMPSNLLTGESVLSRAVAVLTIDVCRDVEVIGWLYQFYISERKDEVFAGFSKNKKAGADEIPAATQLFTPHWIVRYLVENSLGRLWMLNRPASRLVEQMDYYIAPVNPQTDLVKFNSPTEIRVIDPACGSGHMLTYAFDLLYAIYEEEGYAPSDIPGLILSNNLYGIEIDPRAGALAAFALTMKARAGQRTFFNKEIEPRVCVLEPVSFSADELDFLMTTGGSRFEEIAFWNQFQHADTYGSLIQPDAEVTVRLRQHVNRLNDGGDMFHAEVSGWAERVVTQAEYLLPQYSVVVTNPPYMGSKNMNGLLSDMAQTRYPESKSDLFSMFLERACELARPGGIASLVTRDAWMFLSRFTDFRDWLTKSAEISSMAHLGQGVFEGTSGAVVQVVALCATVRRPALHGTYVRLVDEGSPSAKETALRAAARGHRSDITYVIDQTMFASLPGTPIAYWATPALRRTFDSGKKVEDIAPVRQGFQTGDNDQFMRYWHEVSAGAIKRDAASTQEFHESGARFAPYLKGGGFRKWYGNDEFVVRFDQPNYLVLGTMGNKLPSRGLYFKDSITWSALSSGDFGARYAGVGSTFSAKGACAFPIDAFSRDAVLAVFNSSVTRELLEFMGATLDFNVGSLRQIPIPAEWPNDAVTTIKTAVPALVEFHQKDWTTDEASPGFRVLDLVNIPSGSSLKDRVRLNAEYWAAAQSTVAGLQTELDHAVASAYGLLGWDDLPVTLRNKVEINEDGEIGSDFARRQMLDLVSYSVGCMFGRYSLDEPSLILADQGATFSDFLAAVPNPAFTPDVDSVIPIVDGDWFEDDIVARFRQFLRAAFGDQHFVGNLRFVTEALGVKDIRDYFVKSFYKDHVQRYKKRPIYWLFSSPSGSFNALIYLHRYAQSTASTVLNEYLREYKAKLEASRQHNEKLSVSGTGRQQATAVREVDRIRTVLLELDDYEYNVLYPLATKQVAIDLDDGVKINYLKLGSALKMIPGLEAADD